MPAKSIALIRTVATCVGLIMRLLGVPSKHRHANYPGRSVEDISATVAEARLLLKNGQDLRRALLGRTRDLSACGGRGSRRARPRLGPACFLPRRGFFQAAKGHSVNGADHLPLHDLALVDGEVPHTYSPHVDILQITAELLRLFDWCAGSIGNVEVDIAPDASRQA